MDSCALPVTVSALGCAIAAELSDEQLVLAAAVFTQLGDTLATLAARRGLCRSLRPEPP